MNNLDFLVVGYFRRHNVIPNMVLVKMVIIYLFCDEIMVNTEKLIPVTEIYTNI